MQNQSLFNSTKGGTRLLPVLHGGIGTKAGGAHEYNYVFQFVVVGSFIADSNVLQPTGGVNSTPHTSLFSRSPAHDMSHDIGSSVGARHPIHVSCARVIVCSLFDPHFALFIVSLYLPLLLAEP